MPFLQFVSTLARCRDMLLRVRKIDRKKLSLTTTSPEIEKKSVNWTWRIISTVLALALIGFMLSLIQWGDFVDVLKRLSVQSMVAAFAVYVFLNLFRSFRFVALLNRDDISPWRVFPIALYHNFLVRLLPFKLGEFSYIVLMRNRMTVSIEEGVSSLFGSRLLELLMIILVGAVSLLLSGEIIPDQGVLVIVLVIGSIIGGIVGFYYVGTMIRLFNRMMGAFDNIGIVATLIEKLESLAIEFDRIRNPKIFARALFWSCFTYGSSFVVNWILLVSVGIHVDPATLVILVSLGMFATAFPFNISGFGAVELSWTLGLTTFLAMSSSEATSIGLMLNGFQLLCAAISGGIGYAVVQVTGMKKATH